MRFTVCFIQYYRTRVSGGKTPCTVFVFTLTRRHERVLFLRIYTITTARYGSKRFRLGASNTVFDDGHRLTKKRSSFCKTSRNAACTPPAVSASFISNSRTRLFPIGRRHDVCTIPHARSFRAYAME